MHVHTELNYISIQIQYDITYRTNAAFSDYAVRIVRAIISANTERGDNDSLQVLCKLCIIGLLILEITIKIS